MSIHWRCQSLQHIRATTSNSFHSATTCRPSPSPTAPSWKHIRPPTPHTPQRRKHPPIMNCTLRIVLLLDLDQPLHIISPHPLPRITRTDVIRIITQHRSHLRLILPRNLIQQIVKRDHDSIVLRRLPRRREQRLMPCHGMRPGCVGV